MSRRREAIRCFLNLLAVGPGEGSGERQTGRQITDPSPPAGRAPSHSQYSLPEKLEESLSQGRFDYAKGATNAWTDVAPDQAGSRTPSEQSSVASSPISDSVIPSFACPRQSPDHRCSSPPERRCDLILPQAPSLREDCEQETGASCKLALPTHRSLPCPRRPAPPASDSQWLHLPSVFQCFQAAQVENLCYGRAVAPAQISVGRQGLARTGKNWPIQAKRSVV